MYSTLKVNHVFDKYKSTSNNTKVSCVVGERRVVSLSQQRLNVSTVKYVVAKYFSVFYILYKYSNRKNISSDDFNLH